MSAPLAKGLIIAASVLVAAGIAIYSDENLREWIEQRRRRIILAFNGFGDEIGPGSSTRNAEAEDWISAELRRRRRLQIVRRNRAEIIRRAREEGVAVDLDELAAVGAEYQDQAPPTRRRNTTRGFDDLVGSDGRLRDNNSVPEMTQVSSATASGVYAASEDGVRLRGSGARGFQRGTTFGNPFDDEAQLLLDQELIGAADDEVSREQSIRDTETLRSVTPRPMSTTSTTSTPQLIDIPVFEAAPSETSEQSQYKTDDELEAEIQEAIRRSLQDMPVEATPVPAIQVASPTTQTLSVNSPLSMEDSLYASPSPSYPLSAENSQHLPEQYESSAASTSLPPYVEDAIQFDSDDEENGQVTPSGVLTPTEDGFSTAASMAGSNAEDIAVLSDLASQQSEQDARSEAEFSEFSVVGASTPGSWTDVDTDDDAEAANGQGQTIPH